jgi:carboxyl-terminal processing protease
MKAEVLSDRFPCCTHLPLASLRMSFPLPPPVLPPTTTGRYPSRNAGKISNSSSHATRSTNLHNRAPPLPPTPVHAGLAAAIAAALLAASPLAASAVTNEQLVYLDAWRAVDRAYVDKKFNGQNWFKVREDALKKEPMRNREETYAAIRRLLASLDDPFTRFLDPDQYAALRRSTSGAVTGVGVEVSFSADRGAGSPLVVISPAPGGPAERAGIRPGDEILAIDGTKTSELSLYAAGNLLQGADGSTVTLTVRPHGETTNKNSNTGPRNERDMVLTRQPIAFNPVDAAVCDGTGASTSSKVGYIRLATFSKQTAEKVRAALRELKSLNVDRLVLDVRNNGGGLFPAGVEVARMLIQRGDIVLIADAGGVRDVYEAEGGVEDSTTPLTVLVNRGTASASEVLAGALKDNGRATIAGENTFGKGLIQTLVELSDGSAVAVTVAKYQTPAGVDINKVGIEPSVKLDADELLAVPLGAEGFCKYIAAQGAPKLVG